MSNYAHNTISLLSQKQRPDIPWSDPLSVMDILSSQPMNTLIQAAQHKQMVYMLQEASFFRWEKLAIYDLTMSNKIAVIGAGVIGFACAYRIQREIPDVQVCL